MNFDFSEPPESLDAVPEDFRGLYREGDDGKPILQTDHDGVKSAVAAIVRLNNSLKASRAESKNHKSKAVDLSPLADFGDDPAGILDAFNSQLTEAQTKDKEGLNRQVEKIKADLSEAHAKEKQSTAQTIQALEDQLYSVLVQNEGRSVLTELGAVNPNILLLSMEKQIQRFNENGKMVPRVVDAAGDVRYSGATGAPMSMRELAVEMKAMEDMAPFFKSEAPRGGGRQPTTESRPFKQPDRELSPNEKIAAALAERQRRA